MISEVEFAWRESAADSRWVAVTGTNGKTTACALAAHVLAGAGLAAAAVGNIGDPCIEAVAAGRTDVYVAEVSSYQLASTARFAPNVAVLLNITPDHLHWHRSFEAYRDAKLRWRTCPRAGRCGGARRRTTWCAPGAPPARWTRASGASRTCRWAAAG
ncbi:MAG: Mur ligase family protein [Eggerthella lenta]